MAPLLVCTKTCGWRNEAYDGVDRAKNGAFAQRPDQHIVAAMLKHIAPQAVVVHVKPTGCSFEVKFQRAGPSLHATVIQVDDDRKESPQNGFATPNEIPLAASRRSEDSSMVFP